MSMELVQVRNLRKSYADYQRDPFIAVENLSFTAKAGEVFGLLGPNGAGKTTALRILATVLLPTSGQASISNFDVVSQAEMVRCSIGFVSNNTAIYDRMTAWEMVEFFGRLYCVPLSILRNRMETLFTQLQMNEFRDIPSARLSTGMKQKVSIARALIHDPPVLIFDEPTLGLDVLVTRSLHQIILNLKEQGKCILFSTHIMREVERLCDRVAIMHRGQVLDSGSLAELSDRHKTSDFEELFYQLIMNSERDKSQASKRGIWFENLGFPGSSPSQAAEGM
jgi:sodium transport system ATP-binding protein